MKDIDIAKKMLKEDSSLTMVVVKNKEIIFKSKDKGIKPMYILATEYRSLGENASLADRVIGKGASILCDYVGIKEVFAELISDSGINTLNNCKIPFTMEKSCQYIKNRDKTDYCPIEKISNNIEEPILLLERLKEFFASVQ